MKSKICKANKKDAKGAKGFSIYATEQIIWWKHVKKKTWGSENEKNRT